MQRKEYEFYTQLQTCTLRTSESLSLQPKCRQLRTLSATHCLCDVASLHGCENDQVSNFTRFPKRIKAQMTSFKIGLSPFCSRNGFSGQGHKGNSCLSSVSVLPLPCRPAHGFAGLGVSQCWGFTRASWWCGRQQPASASHLLPRASAGACASGSSFSDGASLCQFTKLMVQRPSVWVGTSLKGATSWQSLFSACKAGKSDYGKVLPRAQKTQRIFLWFSSRNL